MSNKQKREGDIEFVPVEKLEEGFRMIAEGAKTLAPTNIWTVDQIYRFDSKITELSAVEKGLYCWKPNTFDRKKFFDELLAKNTKDCFFSVSLTRATLFFKAKFLDETDVSLKFSIPSSFFKVQRRENMRHLVYRDPKAWVDFPDPLFPEKMLRKKLYDVSAGGLAFLVTTHDAPLFASGLELAHFQFSIKDRIITATSEVLHSKPCKGEQKDLGTKVGVKFRDITAADKNFISGYVFEESQKLFSRLKA